MTRDYAFELDTGPRGGPDSANGAGGGAGDRSGDGPGDGPSGGSSGRSGDGSSGRSGGRSGGGSAPLLSAFGGKLTTYRKLAEHGLERLRGRFPAMGHSWTGREPLPGGDMPHGDFDAWFDGFRRRHPWLPEPLARHYARCYGTRAEALLAGAGSLDELGRRFGERLYEREARWLIEREWARTAEDILWRRTKHRLFMSEEERVAFEGWLAGLNITGRGAGEVHAPAGARG